MTREIAGELESPAVQALVQYGGGGEEDRPNPSSMPEEGGEGKGKVPFAGGQEEAFQDYQQGRRQEEAAGGRAVPEAGPGLEEPWVDPTMAFSGGAGAVTKLSLRGAKTIAPTFVRAMTAGTAGAVADYPIGMATEKVGEKVPGLALPFNVITGMVSGGTVETAIEKGVMRYFSKKGVKPAAQLVQETTERVKANLEAGADTADEATIEAVRAINGDVDIADAAKAEGIEVPGAPFKPSRPGEPEGTKMPGYEGQRGEDPVLEDLEPSPQKVDRLREVTGDKKQPLVIEMKDAKGQAERFLQADYTDLPEKAININLNRIDSPERIQEALAKTADLFGPEIQKARRGKQSFKDTERLANLVGMTPEKLLSRRQGQAFNAEEALAARQILVSSAEHLTAVGRKVATGEADDITKYEFQKALATHQAIQAQVSGMTAEAGRALSAFNIMAKETPGKLKAINELLDQRAMGKWKTEDMANLLVTIDSAEGIGKFAQDVRKATTWDMVMEAWINGLLSSPTTHAVNSLSNALTALWQVPERAFASYIGKVLPGQREIQSGEALAQSYGLIEGFKDGLKGFAKTLISGEDPDLLGKLETRYRAISAENLQGALDKMGLGNSNVAARAVDLLGEGVRLPGRFLMAEDSLFKTIGYRMELRARAFRQAASEGLQGDRQAMARRIQEIIDDPPDDIQSAAVDASHYQTFTKDLGEAGKAGQKFLNKAPALRLITPFVRTPTNIVKFAGERTPLALASKNIRADLAAGGARRDLALARMSMGSMIMATMATLTAEGYVTGGGPKDHKLKAAKYRTGWQPYSIKFGDKYVAYNRLEPMGMTFGIAADTAEIIGQVGAESAEDLALASVMAFTKNVTSKTWLRGLSEAIQAMFEPERYGDRYLTNYARTFIPRAGAQVERTMDPELRETWSDKGFFFEVLNSVQSQVPGWSESLPPRRNLWAEPIALEGGLGPDIVSPIYTSEAKESPIDQELVRLQAGIGKPKKTQTIRGQAIPFTPDEYDRFIVAMNEVALPQTGKNLKKSLDDLVTKDTMYRDLDDDRKEIMIKRLIYQAKDMAQEEMYQSDPDIRFLVDRMQFEQQMLQAQ